MQRNLRWLALLGLTFACVLTLAARAQDSPNKSRATAVNALRLLNTAEVTFHHNTGHFATSLSDLAPLIDSTSPAYRERMPYLDPAAGKDALEGFELAIAGDDKSWTFTLKEKKPCGTFAYSDQTGVIYLGKALGCND